MNWEQKFAAIKNLHGGSGGCLRMRKPGDWYVETSGLELKHGEHMLRSPCGNGATPEAAVNSYWESLTTPGSMIVRGAMSSSRKCFRWSGFMWEEVGE